ncbi:MAG: ABC transporter ATP-binding protein [Chloroflexi bacterium]|nr:ABC transporter ATP-binding protein [Chloroflexota bacterium]
MLDAAAPRRAGLLLRYLWPQRGCVLLLAALLLGSIGLQLVGPQIVRYFIDAARAGLLFVGSALANQVLTVAATYAGEHVGWTATDALRVDLLRHCLELDMPFHHARTPCELIERVDGDVTALSNFFSRFVILILGSGLVLAGVLALLYREDWRVGVALTAFVAVALSVLLRVRDVAVPHWRADREASATVYGFLEERLLGLPDIHANGAQPYVMRRFFELARRRFHAGRRAMLMGSAVSLVTNVLFTLGFVIALGLGAVHYAGGAITLGTVYLIYYYTWMLRRPLEQITRQIQDLQKASASILRVQELYDTRSRIEDAPPDIAVPLPAGPLSVEFRNVTFGYATTDDRSFDKLRTGFPTTADPALPPSDRGDGDRSSVVGRRSSGPVLRDLSFSLAPGRTLGVLGRTGSGKTTLTRLLFRLYDVDAGAVCVGGADVRRVRLVELQRRIGLVTQEVQLFRATVRDNLTLFDSSVPDGRLVEVIDEIGLSGWFCALRGGLDTELAAGGGLSAGEAQLLALTRVFLRDPGLVILDEASSRLDPATEALIDRAVRRLLRDRTAIVIAHRLATVQRTDDVLVLDRGRVLEHGPRVALAADPTSHFSRLLRAGATLGSGERIDELVGEFIEEPE